MKVDKKKGLLLPLVVVMMLAAVLSACSNNNNGNNAAPSGSASSSPSASASESTDVKKGGEFRFTLASEPPSLDPALMTDAQSSIVAAGLYEGLYRLNSAGEPEPAIATGDEVSDDGLTYTFKLRDDATWSNGDKVTANDFVYAWKRALNPETASEYAYMLFYIKGGEEYNSGKGSADDVAVKAVNDTTLEVTLKSATPYFPSLVSHYTYLPVHQATVDANPAWAADASTIVSNGPFLLKEWAHEDKLVLEPNPTYFDKDKVNFSKVTISLVEDENTVYNLFETGDIDWIGAQAGSVPTDRTAQVIADGSAEVQAIASTYYYVFNTQKAPFNNVKIRKAFSMAIDRQSIIDNVTQANQTPAYALVPPSIAGTDGKLFREMYPDTGFFSENVEEAKKLLEEGLKEEGLTALPKITLLYNTSEGHKAIAEAAADMWKQNLGVEVAVTNQEWGTFLETRDAGQFDIARAGWGADFNHAINFTYDLIHPKSLNNDGKYSNEQVGKWLDESLAATDEKARLDLIAKAEKQAMDDMAVLPFYYYTTVTMVKDDIQGVTSDYAGHIDWVFGSKK
ncbi:ABC transporter substrate-binding protein [Cohnella thailandensis]|uniref:Peptide ABC transporter substrate-binding protein n=1 Tax=Cohnella thailandensis TaxID=557557 RepID=A0A841SS37_9BACL|nr:peptide ABC transporter substrate-binding protein [Cohnella thailandensis]MBP1975591.1 oligopeptide transport system substrate-binding protein [Cohnella thailandensis]